MNDAQSAANSKLQMANSSGNSSDEQTLVEFPKAGVSQNQPQPAQEPAQTGQVQSQQPQTTIPQQPQSIPAKEQEPLPPAPINEFIAPSEKSVELEPEVKEAGVKETVNEPKLTVEDKIVGIEQAMESIPVNTTPKQKIKYPISLEDAEKVVKGPVIFKNTGNAMLWLAMLILRQFKIKEKEINK
jgi:hypothetical protein